MNSVLVSADQLVLARQGRLLSAPLCFNLQAGQAWHLVGANGSGKTTLLQTLVGLTAPASGQVYWQGKSYDHWGDALRAQWHYCGHTDALKGEWTLWENLLWQGRLMGRKLELDTVTPVVQQMRLLSLLHLPVGQYSKGQQRRAALLGLRLHPRPLWLLDEPFSALDAQGAQLLVQWMDQQCATGGAVIFTTHQSYPPLRQAPHALHLVARSA